MITPIVRDVCRDASYILKFATCLLSREEPTVLPTNIRQDPASVMLAIEVNIDIVDGGTVIPFAVINMAKREVGTLFFSTAGPSSQSVKDYLTKLVGDLQFLGQEVFSVNVCGVERKMEFDMRLSAV